MKKIILSVFIMALLTTNLRALYSYHNFVFGGLTREYLVYIPSGYTGTQALPLVFALHGLGDTISNFMGIGMDRVADTAHFIFVMPQAIADPNFGTAWNSGAGELGITLNPTVDDVGFLNALIDTMAAHYNIDQTRVFCTGFSMGGFMTNRLGCELNNRIAAIASVSGTIGNYLTCNPSRDIPAAHFHGTADQTVNYTGDPFGLDPEALVAYWVHHDHCDTTPASIDTFPNLVNDGKVVVHYKYLNGAYGTHVEFFKVIGGVHEWLIYPANDVDYSVLIWRFFMRFSWSAQATAIEPVTVEPVINVYPNPSSGQVNIQLPVSGDKINEVKITDVTGRTVYSNHEAPGGQLISINAASFSNGLYVIAVNTSGKWISKKLIITE